jgi:uncharacterized protein (TIGR00730 family)
VILRDFIEKEVHHLGLDELAAVDDMRSRKAGLDERADAFVALPGGLGTFEELAEILSFRKLGLHHRPVIILNAEGYYDGLISQIATAVRCDFDDRRALDFFRVTGDPAEAVRWCGSARSDAER